jgi:hypothetical protein
MTVNISCFAGVGWQFFSNNGVPLSGGLIYTYAAGTTTPAATYTSSSGAIAQANPIVLDSSGRVPSGEIWLTSTTIYKFVLQDANSSVIATYDNVPGISTPADLAALVANLANASDPTQGDALIGFRQSNSSGNLTNSVNRTVHTKWQEFVSIKDFGAVGDGTTDDTTAINNALALGGCVYFPSGTYAVTALNLTTSKTTILSENAILLGKSTGTYTAVINIAYAASFTTITGQLTINTQLNPNYTCAINVLAGYCRLENINILNSNLGILIGTQSVSFNQVSLSESFYSKIYTNGCCRGVEVWGLFSVGIFTNCLFVGGENSFWTTGSYDTTTVKVYGGRAYFSMCEFNGSASNVYPMFYVNQSLYSGSYYTGYLTVTEADIECPRALLQVWNQSVSNQASNVGNQIFTNNRIDIYNSQIVGSLSNSYIFSNNVYNGRLTINTNKIYFDNPLTAPPVIQGALTIAQINFNDFSANFPYYGPNVVSFAGYPPEMPFQTLAQAHRTAAFTAINTAVLFDTLDTGTQGQSFPLNSAYSISTGKFTVPAGGLQSVMVTANYTMTGAITAGATAYFVLNSGARSISNAVTFQNALQTSGSITAMFAELVSGDTINFVVYTNNAGQALNVGTVYANTMTIYGMVTNPNA